MLAQLPKINATWDVAFLLFVVAAGFFWGVAKGGGKIKIGIIAIYIASVIFPLIPLQVLVKGSYQIAALSQGIAFVVSVFLLLVLLSRAIRSADSSKSWLRVLLLSVIGALFLASAVLGILSPSVLNKNGLKIAPFTQSIVEAPMLKPWWTILPALGIIFL